MRRFALNAALSVVLAGSVVTVTGPPALAQAPASSEKGRLDVLFIGAHPDDEASGLSTYGQWNEHRGARTGVLTVTRGEGGGNAVGTEEGPALGLLRENEERRAVGKAGVTDIHYLDDVDFYYTVSAPLTAGVWEHREALSKVVRVIRETRPKVIVTMQPAPTPGQHGHHQEAARLATEAYFLAGDRTAFPDQVRRERLTPWAPGRLFNTGGGSAPTGERCETGVAPTIAGDTVYGVWGGRPSARNGGRTWAQVERDAQRTYVSQGWGGFPDVPADPGLLGCDVFTQIHSRVPYGLASKGPTAMLEGAVLPAPGGLPLGTGFHLTTGSFGVSPGRPFTVTAHADAPRALPGARVRLTAPANWNVTGSGALGSVGTQGRTATFTVTPPADASYGRVPLTATLTSGRAFGQTAATVEVGAAVTGVQEPLPRIDNFDAWAGRTGVPALTGRVKRVLTLGSGDSRRVRVDLANRTDAAQSGTVTLDLPDGFSATASSRPYELAAGAKGSVTFDVENTDATLPTSNQGGAGGDHDYTITTTNATGPPDVQKAALELVPVTEATRAADGPRVDGREGAGEYTGATLDLSRVWEGSACESAADCSATGRLTWTADALYLLVKVTDDRPGTVLGADDCKRHWRTDAVEIAIDPRGDSENTSTTFKTGIFPRMGDGRPCFQRDADHHQGPGGETAPGMQVASVVDEPYTGYTVEAKIPFTALPAAVDPARMGLNVFVYDSDTQDKVGQTRIGWSTWGGVQGDPYRWGLVTLPGHVPPSGMPTTAPPAVMPTEVTRSANSPESILQAARTGVPLAGGPAAPPSATAAIGGRPTVSGGRTVFRLRATGPGTAHAYVWDGRVLGRRTLEVDRAGTYTVTVPGGTGTLTVAFVSDRGGTASSAAPLR
ncbi:sugar-binding protein [Thermomonospora umbrina]|uniref:Alpha-galactosidase-like protein n=1 Tax=Thermomonospora umbrina TaxID=111806 RepID=A0A3D9T875_9ACTN|nr:sugar-binding protein [Thermomonospora umbrina]REF00875.1 alpha-galactosidase-like protein [Thermomonospora umbrina]